MDTARFDTGVSVCSCCTPEDFTIRWVEGTCFGQRLVPDIVVRLFLLARTGLVFDTNFSDLLQMTYLESGKTKTNASSR